jgi:hypothetical protein
VEILITFGRIAPEQSLLSQRDQFLDKPYNETHLVELIRQLLGRD